MIPLGFAKGEHYAVLGLARSGLAAAEALAAAGAGLACWDDGAAARERAAARGLPLVNLAEADWSATTALVLSPGIPHSFPRPHPAAEAAKAAEVPIIGDVELLARAERQAIFVGITGTNGKSTTTALIAHLLQAAGRDLEVGGNLGRPVLDFRPLGPGGVYVLELSSYQLELVETLACDVALLLNVTPDHLDRHGGMAGYVAAKKRIFEGQRPTQAAVVGVDDAPCRTIAAELAAKGRRVHPISVEETAPGGVYVAAGLLVDDLEGRAETRLALATLERLPGRHNWQNVAAAYAACRLLGVPAETLVAALPTFPGLAHRQELVAEVAGVRFVNDSKATNADAAAKALGCYDRLWWIAGGRAKEGGLAGLEPFFPRIAEAFLIGEAAEDFARTLEAAGVAAHRCGDLATATAAAFAAARDSGRPGAVVLLSPACASFDQFSDFEARGEAFRGAVQALASGGGA